MLPASRKCTFKYRIQSVKNEDTDSSGKRKNNLAYEKRHVVNIGLILHVVLKL